MNDLKGLIGRLRKASGKDRELDYAISEWHRGPASGSFRWAHYDRYTSSIDAALALVEKVLPGTMIRCATAEWVYQSKSHDWTGGYVNRGPWAVIKDWRDHQLAYATGASLPLAILLAMLVALEKKGKNDV